MSLFGKILAFLNVLAAIAFFALVIIDWSQRQAWAYAAYREDIVLDGLPVDDRELDLEGNLKLARLSNATFESLLPGTPVTSASDKTQEAEVHRVHDRLKAELDQTADETEFRQKLAGMLVPLARTLDVREKAEKQIEQAPIGDLRTGALFEAAFGPIFQPSGDDRGPIDKREGIAHLLFGIQSGEKERQRTAVVIGLRAFTEEANAQATAFREMADRLTVTLTKAQGDFENEYRRLLGEIHLLNQDLVDRKTQLERQQALLEQHRGLLNARITDVQAIRAQLEEAQRASRAALADLTREQQLLFAAQQRVGKAVAENDRLEREIRGLEKVRR